MEIKIAVVMPHRCDRPQFLSCFHAMLASQTVQPHVYIEVNEQPCSDDMDITYRYRTAYDKLRGKGIDAILFMEIDDYYATTYIETMLKQWIQHGKPNLFGTSQTVYYHIALRRYFTMYHPLRASMMNTLIKPDLDINWCADTDPYTDLHLWLKLQLGGLTFTPERTISIGIKHGIGKCAGHNHTTRLERFYDKDSTADLQGTWLQANTTPGMWAFYKPFYEEGTI